MSEPMKADASAAARWAAQADACERALSERPDDPSAWMDLTILYWLATDYGISVGAGMPVDFFRIAGDRLAALLEVGRTRFAECPQVEFWTRYIEWIEYGRPLAIADCRAWLAREPQFKDPAVFAFMTSPHAAPDRDVAQLLAECRGQDTERARYLVSVIESAMLRNGERGTHPA
ncbi:hypothetical protein ACFJIW_05830 [Tahibacter sp. UC22_41]|uniref:hypothetical protein n=1 Tax=Tahibacter sp. UC22_41 TaxID=3350178 RepID=UPI0036D94EA4